MKQHMLPVVDEEDKTALPLRSICLPLACRELLTMISFIDDHIKGAIAKRSLLSQPGLVRSATTESWTRVK
jgi:hypothetical protein